MTTKNSNNKDSANNKSTKKSKADLVEQYLQILILADNGANNVAAVNSGINDAAAAAKNDLNVAEERVLASLNSLADSDTGNPISIDGKKEILDLMKKRAQAQQQEQEQQSRQQQQQTQQQNASVNLLVAIGIIDRLKNRIEHDFQEQYQKYYGQHSL